ATNACGTNTCTFTVTVTQTPAVAITCPASITTNACGGSVVVNFAAPTITGGALQSCIPASGSSFILGTNLVTCTATNACSTNACTFTVTVQCPTNLPSCLPMINPSFEANTFTVLPGYSYVSGNGPITGWTSPGSHGVNPVGGANPFADNGAIPDGNQVAFLQEDGALSQMVGGFTVGAEYCVQYDENSRDCCGTMPSLEVKIGGATIVAAHPVSPVGGSNPYHHVISSTFTAAGPSLELAFIKSNPQGGDTTALIDNVCITPLCVPAPTNMVLWLPLDETSGTISANLVPGGNNGTQVNGPVVTSGLVANSLSFNGTNQYVQIPSYNAINFGTNDFAIDAWVRRATNDTGPNYRVIVEKVDQTTAVPIGYSFWLHGSQGTLGLQLADGNWSTYNSSFVVPNDGQWRHVAVTVDRDKTNGIVFYLNGVAGAGSNDPMSCPGSVSSTLPLRVGSQSSFVLSVFSGGIDEVELFNRVLAPAEIAAIFNAGAAGKCKAPCATPLVVNCPANKVVACGPDWHFDPPTATSCCGTNVTLTILSTETNGFCPLVVTRTWQATDACGNTATCSQTVTVIDTTPPEFTCATNKTVLCGTAWTFDAPIASDACSGTNVTVVIASTVTNVTAVACQTAITRTWQATDACGNTATCSQTVTVVDTMPITLVVTNTADIFAAGLTSPPAFVGGGGVLPPSYSFPTGPGQVLTFSSVSGAVTFTDPNNPLPFTGADGYGYVPAAPYLPTEINSYNGISGITNANADFLVGVFLDSNVPANSAPPALDFKPSGLTTSFPSLSPLIGQTFFIGDGLTGTGSGAVQQFVVPPTATRLFLGFADGYNVQGDPSWYGDNHGFLTVTFQIGGTLICATNKIVQCGANWDFDPPTVMNDCSGATNLIPTVLTTITNGICPQEITRTWQVVDACGNTNICSQTVTVEDTTAPVLTCAPDKTVVCGTTWDFDPPTAVDNCSGTNMTIAVTSTVTNAIPVACQTTITRTWQATDACGNTATCSQT
ncbi:MAG: LamG-like jellyroll fold domain-containing protein, partial [Verrucomicrobiota bacterium]